MNFHLGVSKIIEQIIKCSIGEVDLYSFLDNVWGIYKLIKDEGTIDFQNMFHISWDRIDEIVALNVEDKSMYTEILPTFKQNMIKYL